MSRLHCSFTASTGSLFPWPNDRPPVLLRQIVVPDDQ
jgi:hypothetical protein